MNLDGITGIITGDVAKIDIMLDKLALYSTKIQLVEIYNNKQMQM